MAKKKSKTQKYKKNLKKKINKINKAQDLVIKDVKKEEIKPLTEIDKKVEKKKTVKPKKENKLLNSIKSFGLKVKDGFNSLKTKLKTKKKPKTKTEIKKPKLKKVVKKSTKAATKVTAKKATKKVSIFTKISLLFSNLLKKKDTKKKPTKKVVKEVKTTKIVLPKNKKVDEKKEAKLSLFEKIKLALTTRKVTLERVPNPKKNLQKKVKKSLNKYKEYEEVVEKTKKEFVEPEHSKKNNIIYWAFNIVLLLTFILLINGLRVTGLSTKFIIYIAFLLFILIGVAILLNRYVSGKVFTCILVIGMAIAIIRINDTYDYIHSLDKINYETKTYYVVTLDSVRNTKIYNLNNKKIALLKGNEVNEEKILNIKLDGVRYELYEDFDVMINGLFSSNYRAVILSKEEYNRMENTQFDNRKKTKILYTFEAVSKK